MKKYIFYFLLIFISFSITFIFTFPIKDIVSFYLNRYGIRYSNIEGNFFNIKISEISYKDFYIDELILINKILFFNIFLDKNKIIDVNIVGKILKINTKDLNIENFQKKPKFYGNLNLDINIFIKDRYILIEGKGKANIRKISFLPFLSTLNIKLSIENKYPKNIIYAVVNSSQINGKLNADIIIPLDKKTLQLNGLFEGKFFNRKIKQKINIEFIKNMFNTKLQIR